MLEICWQAPYTLKNIAKVLIGSKYCQVCYSFITLQFLEMPNHQQWQHDNLEYIGSKIDKSLEFSLKTHGFNTFSNEKLIYTKKEDPEVQIEINHTIYKST